MNGLTVDSMQGSTYLKVLAHFPLGGVGLGLQPREAVD